jgi:hypothetical protein
VKNATNNEIERMLVEMNRMLRDSEQSDQSKWLALNQLESFLTESHKLTDKKSHLTKTETPSFKEPMGV